MIDLSHREPLPAAPVRHPSAWRGEALARDRSWVHDISALAPALDAAVDAVLARGLAAGRFASEDFQPEGLDAFVSGVVHELAEGRGCVLIKGLDVTRYDAAALEALYWGIGVHLGTPISQNKRGELIAHVTDSGRDYETKNVRGYTTNNAIRPHCDGSDVVGLLCADTSARGGASVLASSVTVFNIMLEEYPEYLPHLAQGFHFDLRGHGATGDADEVTWHKVPVFSCVDGVLSARYNPKVIVDGQRKAGDPLTGERLAAVEKVAEIALRDDVRFDMRFEQGDLQLLSNYTVLHAREAFEDDRDHKRDLLRLWINLREPRPLLPALADRYNTGPRGGMAIEGVDY